ncbi:MAG: MFS transporter [Ktedonobacteraceae bacterium]|nr:MFS transporter [Ktedonobacteraceae bacterium]
MLSTRFGLPHMKGATCFIVAAFIDMLGTGMFAPFSLLYFQVKAGLSLSSIGLALSMAMMATLLVIPLTGVLVDHIGAKRLVLCAQLLQGLGFLGYLIVAHFVTLVGFALLVTSGQSMFWSSYFTLVAEIGGADERDRWYGLVGALRTTGLGLGSFLAGLAVTTTARNGYDLVVLFNALSFFVAAGLVLFGVRGSPRRKSSVQTQGYQAVLRDRPFLLLIVANICFALCSNFLYLAVPVYFTTALKMPIWFVGVALAFNTVFVATMQTMMVRWLEPFKRTRALMGAGGIWCIWCVTSALAIFIPQRFLMPSLLVVGSLYGLAQMIHTPTSNALAAGSSPEALRGRYLAIYQYSFFLANIVGPSLFAFLFTRRASLPWLVIAAIAVIGSLILYRIEPHLPRQAIRSQETISKLAANSPPNRIPGA